MSTISSVQEAREALCNGELFQIGGRFINPRDIVEVDPNGGTNPIFRLEDGRTVQHNRFTPGDVGDYLAAALDYAQRGGAQSEAIKPPFNRIAIGEAGLFDPSGAKLGNYSGETLGGLDIAAGYAFTHQSYGNQAFRRDLAGGNPLELDITGGGGAIAGTAVHEEKATNTLWAVVRRDADSSIDVTKVGYDNTNPTTVFSGTGFSFQQDRTQRLTIDEEEGIGFLGGADVLNSFQLDGSSTQFLANTGERGPMALDTEGKRIFQYRSGRQIRIYDYTGTEIAFNSIDDQCLGLDYIPSIERLIFFDKLTNTVKTVNPDASDVKVLFSVSSGDGLRAGLDVSAL